MIKLSDLVSVSVEGFDPEITNVTSDSRLARRGFLFAALSGVSQNGADFIEFALRAGAVAVLAKHGTPMPESDHEFAVVYVDEPRRELASVAARFYKQQPEHIVAVTGTNGKTSSCEFVRQLWALSDIKGISVGTLGVRGASGIKQVSMTTPDPVSLHANLADLKAAGFEHLAMEASSHGLDQYRLDGVRVQVAAFTNLSHDHLDYHQTMEEYGKAKQRLFTEVLSEYGIAVLNADSNEFERLSTACEKAGRKYISFGFAADDIKIKSCKPMPDGQDLELSIFGEDYNITLPLVGKFQAKNALCALGCIYGCLDAADRSHFARYVELMEHLCGVPGRLQLITGHPSAAVYVDYAHTPDALSNVLEALRPHTNARLICLVGCGGDRDKTKRPVMARIASELADLAVITDDNPRSEDPAQIRKDMLVGAPEAREIGGRRAAIEWAVGELKDGDVLVIAGKGHEQGQIIGDKVQPFDDREEAKAAIEKFYPTHDDSKRK